VTFGIAALPIAYVIISHLFNPFYATYLSWGELSYFLLYLIAVCLTAALPYLTNVNLRQRQQAQDILRERRRLAREIHDSVAQTLSALRWQAQLLHHRFAEKGMNLDEVTQLEQLAEQAHQDVRQSLELLHYTDGNFLQHLKKHLECLKGDADIDFQLDMPTAELGIEPAVQFELWRICQEALTNIRKHSAAHNVHVKLSSANNRLELSIADDGCGFDATPCFSNGREGKGHGLTVMKERAEGLGGRLGILSLPGKGTEVKMELPLATHRGRLWML
jgi:signal transduction histidine kinase